MLLTHPKIFNLVKVLVYPTFTTALYKFGFFDVKILYKFEIQPNLQRLFKDLHFMPNLNLYITVL